MAETFGVDIVPLDSVLKGHQQSVMACTAAATVVTAANGSGSGACVYHARSWRQVEELLFGAQ